MKCQDVMTSDPMFCMAEDTVAHAARLMKAEEVGPIPVVGDAAEMKLEGIITDRDIVVKVVAEDLDPQKTTIGAVMTRDPVTCRPRDDVEEAMKAMTERRVRRVPVVDDAGSLRGIISQADLAIRIGKAKKTGNVIKEISQPDR